MLLEDGNLKARAHVFVSGDVQGVLFRSATEAEAEGRDVKGWVKNSADGRVEAVFEGEEEAVEAMVEFCRHGPPHARVTNVDVTWKSFKREFSDFRIRYS